MSTITIFQVSLEIWGIAFCLIAAACISAMKSSDPAYKRRKISMQLSCICLLLSDALAYVFRSQPGDLAFFMVRLSNFLVFGINYYYACLFGNYLWRSCCGNKGKVPARLLAVYMTSTISIVLLVISQFNHMYYYFDETNTYHRGDYFIFTQVLAVINMVLCFSILIENRKLLDKMVYYTMLAYFVLPVIATVFQTFFYGLSLQNFSMVFSTQIMFAVDFVDLSRKLDTSKSAFQAASHAAEHDSMTGLFNKTAGIRKIEAFLTEMKADDTASLVFLDIDDFKSINDTYGHTVGDFWINQIAQLLTLHCRENDIVCRFGGDEYIVFLKNLADLRLLQLKIDYFFAELKDVSVKKNQTVHCSIGICRIFGTGQKASYCIECADAALYEAKRKGKNTFVIKDRGVPFTE